MQISRGQTNLEAKEQIIGNLILSMLWVGLIALVPSVIAAWVNGLYGIVVLDVIAYGALLFIKIYGSIEKQLLGIVVITFLLGFILLIFTGIQGAGYVWFLFSIVISALLGKKQYTPLVLLGSALVMMGYTVLTALEMTPVRDNFWLMIVITTNSLVIAGVLALVIAKIDSQTAASMQHNEQLIIELQHRVRNNIQILLAVAGLGDNPDVLERRQILAIEGVNDIILGHSEGDTIDVREVIDIILNTLAREDLIEPGIWNIQIPHYSAYLLATDSATTCLLLMEILWQIAETHPGKKNHTLVLELDKNAVLVRIVETRSRDSGNSGNHGNPEYQNQLISTLGSNTLITYLLENPLTIEDIHGNGGPGLLITVPLGLSQGITD